jgi:hypothetical protein
MPDTPRVAEITLCAAWHAGSVPTLLETTDGRSIEIVHRGSWSHGLGPDFRDALILCDGRELRAGSIEVHLRTRGWIDHGHHLDPVYDNVILHLAGRHDGTETRRHDGAIVPVVEIGPVEQFAVPELAKWDWDRVGGQSCAEHLTSSHPQAVCDVLHRLGDIRLAARSARIEARLQTEPAGEILWRELLDGLGYATNREPMRALADRLPLADLESLLQRTPPPSRLAVARGVLLGVAGFLPLSPTEAHLGRLGGEDITAIEDAWHRHGHPWVDESISPTLWRRARVRPANHPLPRLLAGATIIARASESAGLLPAVTTILSETADPVTALRDLASNADQPSLGEDRALDILVSALIPLALAIAAHSGNIALADGAAHHWATLPAPASNAVTRRAVRQVAGASRLGKIGARGAQGLIQLDTTLCQPRRCFECPIAAAQLAVKA